MSISCIFLRYNPCNHLPFQAQAPVMREVFKQLLLKVVLIVDVRHVLLDCFEYLEPQKPCDIKLDATVYFKLSFPLFAV